MESTVAHRLCRFCGAQVVTPVLVAERYGVKTRTAYYCPVCGEVLFVVWSKRKKDREYALKY